MRLQAWRRHCCDDKKEMGSDGKVRWTGRREQLQQVKIGRTRFSCGDQPEVLLCSPAAGLDLTPGVRLVTFLFTHLQWHLMLSKFIALCSTATQVNMISDVEADAS